MKRAEAYAAKAPTRRRANTRRAGAEGVERALLDEDEMPSRRVLEAVEPASSTTSTRREGQLPEVDRTSASYDPEARRARKTGRRGRRRRGCGKKPRVAKDTAADVLERLVADAGGIFAFWGRDAWRSTLARRRLRGLVSDTRPPRRLPARACTRWSRGYAAAAPFAPFSELMKVGPWRPQTPPSRRTRRARAADASCSLAVS